MSWRLNKTVSAKAYKILPSAFNKCFSDKVRIFGITPLKKSSLQLLFVIVGSGIYLLPRQGIDSGVIHYRGRRSRRRVKVLHQLGGISPFFQIKCKLDRVGKGASRVARHKIRNQILLLAELFGYPEVFFLEFVIKSYARLPHHSKHVIAAVLGSHLQLTADIIAHKLSEEAVITVMHQVIISDTRTDKDLFNLG